MLSQKPKIFHKTKPPCYCHKCLKQSIKDDQQRARILSVLEAIEACDRRYGRRRCG